LVKQGTLLLLTGG